MYRKAAWLATFAGIIISCNNSGENKTADDTASVKPVNTATGEIPQVDTAVAGIKLADTLSFKEVISPADKFCEGETYCLATQDGQQLLRASMHPGADANTFWEFELKKGPGDNYKRTTKAEFVTGLGIKLGMTKEEVAALLKIKSIEKDTMTYAVEQPGDTPTKLLARYNLPKYYQEFEFAEGKLVRYRFGLEYP